MKHIWSGCYTAFKYLVLYFKFNHFALNQIQLYFLFPSEQLYNFCEMNWHHRFSSVTAISKTYSLIPFDTSFWKCVC